MRKETIRSGLSSFESKVISDMVAEGKTVFSIKELAEKAGSSKKAIKTASRLVKKRWLERLRKGIYLVMELGAGSKPEWTEDSFFIASKLANPSYIGYYSMLNHYGWTEQVPFSITVATTKILKNKVIFGVNYEFINLNKKKFFGFMEKNIHGHKIKISDPEKTIVDALDHPEYCGGIDEVAKAMVNAKNELDWEKVTEYAKKMGNGAIFKRLGYLAETMEINLPEKILTKIKENITEGYAPLFPDAGKKGTHNSKWKILVNVNFSKERVLA